MKKIIILVLIILLICTDLLFASDNPTRTDTLWNGYGWKEFEKDKAISDNYKWIFLVGLNDGSQLMVVKAFAYAAGALGAQSITPAMELATVKLAREAYLGAIRPRHTEEELIKKIDEIYENEENRIIPVAMIAYIVKDLFMGKVSEEKFDQEIKGLRQVAREMQRRAGGNTRNEEGKNETSFINKLTIDLDNNSSYIPMVQIHVKTKFGKTLPFRPNIKIENQNGILIDFLQEREIVLEEGLEVRYIRLEPFGIDNPPLLYKVEKIKFTADKKAKITISLGEVVSSWVHSEDK